MQIIKKFSLAALILGTGLCSLQATTLVSDDFPGSGANSLDPAVWAEQPTSGGTNGIYHPSSGDLYVVGAYAGGGPGTFAVENTIPTFAPTLTQNITLDVQLAEVADTFVGFMGTSPAVGSIALRSDQGADWAVETPDGLVNTGVAVNSGGSQEVGIDWTDSSVTFLINGVDVDTLSYTATGPLPMFIGDETSGQDTQISSVVISSIPVESVPEPTSAALMLMSLGAIGLCIVWKKRTVYFPTA